MEIFLQCVIIAIVGMIIGGFCTILFFRLDKSWKQILLGFGGIITTGGVWVVVQLNLSIPNEYKTLALLVLMLSIIISVYFSFTKLCTLLKGQTGDNIIRVLDIVLGYDGFLKDYYESRKKSIDKSLRIAEIERKTAELERKESYLQNLQNNIENQKNNSVVLELPENRIYAITNQFIHKIPYFVNHISKFENNVDRLTEDFLELFTDEKKYNAECLKGYFAGIGMYVANDLFGTSNEDVRTHFRILKGEQYVQYSVVVGQRISEDKITDIPRCDSGMIKKSFDLKKSLVASLNPESAYDTKTTWEDYMTITYYNFLKGNDPFLSMGISIKYSEQFRDMLYFLNFYKIEESLQVYMNRINKVCDIVETLKGA